MEEEKTNEAVEEKKQGATKEMSSMERELRCIRSINCALDKVADVSRVRVLDYVRRAECEKVDLCAKQAIDRGPMLGNPIETIRGC